MGEKLQKAEANLTAMLDRRDQLMVKMRSDDPELEGLAAKIGKAIAAGENPNRFDMEMAGLQAKASIYKTALQTMEPVIEDARKEVHRVFAEETRDWMESVEDQRRGLPGLILSQLYQAWQSIILYRHIEREYTTRYTQIARHGLEGPNWPESDFRGFNHNIVAAALVAALDAIEISNPDLIKKMKLPGQVERHSITNCNCSGRERDEGR